MDPGYRAFETLNGDLKLLLGDKLGGLIIQGSYAVDDFVANWSDLDYLAVLEGDLSDDEVEGIFELHDRYRNRADPENPVNLLEGVLIHRGALVDRNKSFRGCYVGTRRRGWKPITRNTLNHFDEILIRQRGISMRGQSPEIHIPTNQEVAEANSDSLRNSRTWVFDEDFPVREIAQWGCRALYLPATGVAESETRVVRWVLDNHGSPSYRAFLEWFLRDRASNDPEIVEQEGHDLKPQALAFLDLVEEVLGGQGTVGRGQSPISARHRPARDTRVLALPPLGSHQHR